MGAGPDARSVLVIEDEPGIAETIALHLQAEGLKVEIVVDGLAALVRLDSPPPDLVLLDLGLPEVSGFRVMNVLRRTPGWERTPVVVATAYNFEEAQEIIRDGIDEFMTKPFDMKDLVERVGAVIRRKSAAT